MLPDLAGWPAADGATEATGVAFRHIPFRHFRNPGAVRRLTATHFDVFIPVSVAVMLISDLSTSVLLYAQMLDCSLEELPGARERLSICGAGRCSPCTCACRCIYGDRSDRRGLHTKWEWEWRELPRHRIEVMRGAHHSPLSVGFFRLIKP
jgi:hypothetical protein